MNQNTTSMRALTGSCPYCGAWHSGVCPRVKKFEYNDTGMLRSVEFHAPHHTDFGTLQHMSMEIERSKRE